MRGGFKAYGFFKIVIVFNKLDKFNLSVFSASLEDRCSQTLKDRDKTLQSVAKF